MTDTKEIKSYPIYLTKEPDEGIVEAIVSVFGIVDEGYDIIHPGAFTKTILERGLRIPVLDHHNHWSIMDTLGKVIEIRELNSTELPETVLEKYPNSSGGLLVTIQFLLNTKEGLGAYERIKSGVITEYSIGYQAHDYDFTNMAIPGSGSEVMVRNLRTIKLWEVSPVIWGMNPATVTTNVKNRRPKGKDSTSEEEAGPLTTPTLPTVIEDLDKIETLKKKLDLISKLTDGG